MKDHKRNRIQTGDVSAKRSHSRSRRWVLFFAALFCTGVSGVGHSAGLGTQMLNMFGSMSNSTPSTFVGNTTGTGVIGGPGFVMKNHISSTNLVAWVPPSFSAGCGGIDWYAGSLSFINKGEFQQLLRDIASNGASAAIGYAFEVALDAMCPSCLSVMEQLQQKIAKMNGIMSDSCRAGEWLVDTLTPDGLRNKKEIKDRMTSVARATDSLFENLGFKVNKSGQELEYESRGGDTSKEEPCSAPVNVLWCTMREKDAAAGFESANADDTDLMQAIMGLVGTVIIDQEQDYTKGGTPAKSTPIFPRKGVVKIRDLVNGGDDVMSLKCKDGTGAKQCLKVEEEKTHLKGMEEYISEVLLGTTGDGKTDGVVYKFVYTPKVALTDTERKVYKNLPLGAGEMIRKIANVQPDLAVPFVRAVLPHLAFEMVVRLVDDMIMAARETAGKSNSLYMPMLNEVVREALEEIRGEKVVMQQKYGSVASIFEVYNNLMTVAQANEYDLVIGGPGR